MAITTSLEVHCAPQEERLRRGDDLRLQMALEESRRDTVKVPKKKEVSASRGWGGHCVRPSQACPHGVTAGVRRGWSVHFCLGGGPP